MNDKLITPMRAADLKGNAALITTFPVWASAKMDGYRATTQRNSVWSKNNKLIPNGFVQRMLGHDTFQLLDGELIVGDPADDPLQRTSSGVTTRTGEPDFTLYVFDDLTDLSAPFDQRLAKLRKRFPKGSFGRVKLVPQKLVRTQAELDAFEDECVAAGYEGVMVRSLDGHYKQGGSEPRSTVTEMLVAKLKRVEHHEAKVLKVHEQMANKNEATKDEIGRTKRSTAKAGKVGKGVLGGCTVQGISGRWKGVTYDVGTGFSDEQRAILWTERAGVPGRIMKIETGRTPATFKKPQFPRFKDWKWDGDL